MTPRESKIREILDELLRQRQAMRGSTPDPGLIKANRLAIAYWQRQLRLSAEDELPGRRRPPERVERADAGVLRGNSSH